MMLELEKGHVNVSGILVYCLCKPRVCVLVCDLETLSVNSEALLKVALTFFQRNANFVGFDQF